VFGYRSFRAGIALLALALLMVIVVLAWRHAVSGRLDSESQWESAFGVAAPSWDAGRGKDSVPGLDKASATCGLMRGKMAVVVWTDLPGSSSSFLPPITTKPEGYVFEGLHRGPDGREVNCRCATRDGQTGTVKIGDETFDLAKGSLFLVSTRGDHNQVRQLQRDTSRLKSDDLKDLARTDPDIMGFFETSAKSK
jgi:hypothetical protein